MSNTFQTQISVIIPTLNERENLPYAVATISGAKEILIVDGGSTDGTCEWVATHPSLRLLTAPRGRGSQLATGAHHATGDILLFLHADCQLPENALTLIQQCLSEAGVVGGCFSVRFARTDSAALRQTAKAINLHSRLTRTATGDQGIFVRRSVYEHLGGFPPWPLFEDVGFVDRLRPQGYFIVLPDRITISARRWETFGVARTNALMVSLWLGYRLGIPPAVLKRWFADVRPPQKATPP